MHPYSRTKTEDDPSGRRTEPTSYDGNGPQEGAFGPKAHAFRDERVPCPACDGSGGRLFCDYCAGAGRVSRSDANVIRRQMQAGTEEMIG